MDPSVDIDEGEVGKFSRCIFESLPNLRGQSIKDIREALTNCVEVVLANFRELAGCSRNEICRTCLFPE